MNFIDFFSGIGGFRRGLELAGHTCVGFCEFDKFAVASYVSMHCLTEEQRRFLASLPIRKRQKEILKDEYKNGEWYERDIKNVRSVDLPRAECWAFGAPCQDFSVAGNRLGLDGDRSSLVREIFRLLEEQKEEDRPEWLIYENVKGMLSSNRGLDYLSILSELDRLGYDCEWQIINSRWWVPQNRERVYTIGHLRRFGRRKILPVTGADGENSLRLIGLMNGRDSQRDRVYAIDGTSQTLSTCPGGNTEPKIAEPVFCDLSRESKTTDIARAVMSRYNAGVVNHKGVNSGIAIPVLTPDRAEKRQNGRRFKENEDLRFTLTAQDRHRVAMKVLDVSGRNVSESKGHLAHCLNANDQRKVFGAKQNRTLVGIVDDQGRLEKKNKINPICSTIKSEAHGNIQKVISECDGKTLPCIWSDKYQCYLSIRKLTPKECFRLQGWTDDYFDRAQFVNSDSQLYKQAGNGVTVNAVYEIGKKINEVLR